MDVGNIAYLATSMAQQRVDQSLSVAVLRKALDVQAGGAMLLLAALPAPPSLPANLGQNVNTTA